MSLLCPKDRTYPRPIRLHEISAGDVIRVWFRRKSQPEHSVVGIVAGRPGQQFRKRLGRYWLDIQRCVGATPTCIETGMITAVEMVAPGPDSLLES